MEAKDIVQRGNTLQGRFLVTNYSTPYATKTSQDFIISGSGLFQVKVIAAQVNNGHSNIYNNLIFIKFTKAREEDEVTYVLKFSSHELDILEKKFTSDDGTYHLIHEHKKQQYTFDVNVEMDILPSFNSFGILHEDTDLTDFELRGEDGHVRMHRAVLAAASPVFRRMFGGTWRETTEGNVDVPGTSKATLQHLKDYVYLHTVPDSGLEQLLLLASYYMMIDLERKCVEKLVNNLTAENARTLLEFAAMHKLTSLLLAILESVQQGSVKVSDMKRFF